MAAVMMVNHEIFKRLGKERDACSLEAFKGLLDQMDDILQTIAAACGRPKVNMKSSKPKGKTPSLIGSTLGGVRPTTVERECACRRCDTPIPKGTYCYEISHLGGSFARYKRYCDDCFDSILKQTQAVRNAVRGVRKQED